MKYDCIIIGAGTSGCSLAYNLATFGIKTLLVEKNNFLGGLMTGGLVCPIMKSSVDELNCNYYSKLIQKAKAYNAQITYKLNEGHVNDGWLNPEMMKIVLADLLTQDDIKKHLDIILETTIKKVNLNKNNIKSIEFNSKILSQPIEAKYYIDATGNSTLSKLSNCTILSENNQKQKETLRFIVSNVDVEKFCKFILKVDCDRNITNTYRNDKATHNELHFTTASCNDNSNKWALDTILQKAVENGDLLSTDREYFQIFSIAGAKNCVAFNCPRLDDDDLSLGLLGAYKSIYRLLNFTKKYFKGFENAIISNIASITGRREEGRVLTKYIYTKEDMLNKKQFKHPILRANYNIDIHSDKKTPKYKTATYELPIEALISKEIDNLFVVGKIIGADFEAQSALRVQKSCMQMAEGLSKYIKNLFSNTEVIKDIV